MQSADINFQIQNQIAPRGSSLYYSLMTVSQDQRLAICAVRSFAKEITDIVLSCSDLTVAQQKFAWWQGELQQLLSSTPTHPVTKILHSTLKQFKCPTELFLEFMNGIRQDLEQMHYDNTEELMHYYHHTAGAIERIIAHILGFTDQQTLMAVNYLGISQQIIKNIRDIRKILIHQQCYIAQSDLEKCHLSISQLQQFNMTQEVRALLQLQAQMAIENYHKALDLLPAVDRYKQCSTLTLAELSLKLLEQLLAPNNNIFKEYVSLTPLRKLWVSWKVQRREKKLNHLILLPAGEKVPKVDEGILK